MATVPLTNRFHTTTKQVPTNNLGSAQANSDRETYSMQDIADTASTVISTFPSFTTELDTEIEVAPIIIAGVSTPLYYKRYRAIAPLGGTGSQDLYAGISTIFRTNIIISTQLSAANYGELNPGFLPSDGAARAVIFNEPGKNLLITEVYPKYGATGAFTANYIITFEIWYT